MIHDYSKAKKPLEGVDVAERWAAAAKEFEAARRSNAFPTEAFNERVSNIYKAHRQRPCTDDASFADALGYDCSAWRGYDCASAPLLRVPTTAGGRAAAPSYSADDARNLQRRCPKACGLCGDDSDNVGGLSTDRYVKMFAMSLFQLRLGARAASAAPRGNGRLVAARDGPHSDRTRADRAGAQELGRRLGLIAALSAFS